MRPCAPCAPVPTTLCAAPQLAADLRSVQRNASSTAAERRIEAEQAVLQRFDQSAAAVQREFDVERSEIAAVRLKRAQHVDRRRRLGTAAALAPPQLAGSWMTSGARPATAP